MRAVECNFEHRRGGVVLKEINGTRALRIFIGETEARAIDKAIHDRHDRRPMTHDLIANILEGLQATLMAIHIDELKDETFYGKLVIEIGENDHRRQALIDSRPSDALALAARARVPIFTTDEVLDEAGVELDL